MSNKNNTTTSVPKKPYMKIGKKLKLEIRKQYELGIELLELAREHKLNYGTLKNCSSNEGWVKGSTVEVVYQREREVLIENLVHMRGEELKKLMVTHSIYATESLEDALLGIEPTKSRAEALLNRERALSMQVDRAYKLFNIRDDIEEKEYQLLDKKLKKAEEEINRVEKGNNNKNEDFEG